MDQKHDEKQRSGGTRYFKSLDEIDRGIEELQARVNDLRKLQLDKARFNDPSVVAVQRAVRNSITDVFGSGSTQSNHFLNFAIWSGAYMNLPEAYVQRCFENGFAESIEKLEAEIQVLKSIKEDFARNIPVESATENEDTAPICVRCSRPVKNSKDYTLYEKMHWLCFHMEFEHQSDPDDACEDPSCPWWHIEVYKSALKDLGQDPQTVFESAITKRFNL